MTRNNCEYAPLYAHRPARLSPILLQVDENNPPAGRLNYAALCKSALLDFPRTIDYVPKLPKTKGVAMKKVLFKSEESKTRSDVASFLRQPADTVEAGSVILRQGDA